MRLYVLKNENGNFAIWVEGRSNLESKDLPYQAAISRAKDIINNSDESGDIILYKHRETFHID